MTSGPLTQGLRFYDPITLQWCFNELSLNVETPISLVMLFTEHRPPPSMLRSCTLNSGLPVSMESTRVPIWQPLVMFHRGIYHPQPTQILPPTATKNSPGEKCYYEKEWLFCDSHCFIKKIFFLKQIFSRRIQRFFQSYSKHRTAHTISQRSAAS